MKTYILTVLLFIVSFSTAAAQNGNSEVFVFSVTKSEKGYKLAGGENISNSPGYDNQPSFAPSGKSIVFTSIRGEESSDIYEYLFETKTIFQITTSDEGEYTPRAKDDNTIYFIREGAGQEMTIWKYDRETKSESRALESKEPVAYYDWNSKGEALVWVRYASMAHYLDPAKKINLFVTDHVLPSSPQNIPGTAKFSFVHRQGNNEIWIKEFDPETQSMRPIVQVKDGKIDYCWLNGNTIIMGSGPKLFGYKDKPGNDWYEFADLKEFGLKDITRLAASKKGDKLAVVSNQ